MRARMAIAIAVVMSSGCPDAEQGLPGEDSGTTGEATSTAAASTTGIDDGVVDDSSSGCVPSTFFPDLDGDGFGDAAGETMACSAPADHVDVAGDCDDADGAVHPDATEACNRIDDDCDREVDEGVCIECEELFNAASGRTYLLCDTALTWTAAQAHCEGASATLLIVSNASEQIFLASQTISLPSWIGLSDQATEGDYAWADGSPYEYMNWSDGQPDDPTGDEDCVAMNLMRRWEDLDCDGELPFICEMTD